MADIKPSDTFEQGSKTLTLPSRMNDMDDDEVPF
jgi:hypothetical protein